MGNRHTDVTNETIGDINGNHENRDHCDLNSVDKEDGDDVLSKGGGKVTRLEIQIYVKVDWQERAISITWGFREVPLTHTIEGF